MLQVVWKYISIIQVKMTVPVHGTFYIFKGIDVFITTNLISKKLMFKFEHEIILIMIIEMESFSVI